MSAYLFLCSFTYEQRKRYERKRERGMREKGIRERGIRAFRPLERERERVCFLSLSLSLRNRERGIRAFRPLFFTIFTLETHLDIHKRALQFTTKELSNSQQKSPTIHNTNRPRDNDKSHR